MSVSTSGRMMLWGILWMAVGCDRFAYVLQLVELQHLLHTRSR